MAEWRKVEEEVSDGTSQTRTEVTYQFGAEIDGVFVPAFTKSGGYVDHLVEREKARQERDAESKDDKAGAKQATSTTQTKSGS